MSKLATHFRDEGARLDAELEASFPAVEGYLKLEEIYDDPPSWEALNRYRVRHGKAPLVWEECRSRPHCGGCDRCLALQAYYAIHGKSRI